MIGILEKFLLVDTFIGNQCFNTWYSANDAKYFPTSFWDKNNRVKVKFEEEYFWAPKDYIKYLEISYGNWQELPPENERGGHGDIIIDFENDYKKYYTGK